MAVFQAFRALRPVPEMASAVAALPYDVVTREEAKMIGDRNPDSFLHVDRPEMDMPDETDLYDAKVYDKARENLEAARDALSKPFEYADKLADKINRLNEVNHKLGTDKAEDDIPVSDETEPKISEQKKSFRPKR